jgi:hypothetical protein
MVSLYLMICRISMQNCVQDLFDTIFSRYTCYDTVSTYDTTLISLIINYGDTSAFCMHGMHDTSYDITIVTSLSRHLFIPRKKTFFRHDINRVIFFGQLHLIRVNRETSSHEIYMVFHTE